MIMIDDDFFTYNLPSPIKIRDRIDVTIPLDFKGLRNGKDIW